ncbi:hypothetical protein THSYN_08435 [Candidatus Thiodictyon syntrophicum]|uniref:Lytic murein transglycosylase n=1 Tax=Candidatus Thiodictyon syntrophicum TaxID=1166950 RepID=A0A2K8U5V9_9GAMM|nr:hypothetical protein THSYN_08435 [Candidatus Thiodictyon syntrophicum]
MCKALCAANLALMITTPVRLLLLQGDLLLSIRLSSAAGRRSSPCVRAPALLLAAVCASPLAAPLDPGKSGAQAPTASPALPTPAAAFETWREAFSAQALALGLAPSTLDAAFEGVSPLPRVLALDRRQAEYTRTFFDYLTAAVSPARITRGRELLQRHARLLADIGCRHGVPPELLVALWAMETDYGTQTGGFPVIAALATLAWDGRRRDFFTTELIEALHIVDSGQAAPADLTGSWAGAMGQPQFMPSTYRRYARDGDGDGRADIWHSVADALESAAHYLSAAGWNPEQGWGREVLLPPDFPLAQARLGLTKDIDEWDLLDVLGAAGEPLAGGETPGSIVLPAGAQGPAFLVLPNFQVIYAWNRSLYYALTVGYLSDRLRGAGPLSGRPPPGDQALPRARVIVMQQGLKALGFELGEPDGMIGVRTRDALQDYQQARGLPADAYPTVELIARIEREAGQADQERAGRAAGP